MVKLEDLYTVYFLARKNKRRSEDAVIFELDYEKRLRQLCDQINEKTYRAKGAYTFISVRPKPREVFACELEARIVQWYIVWRLLPILEQYVLTERSYNNRKGMGVEAAVQQLEQDMDEVSEHYTRPAYIIQWDIQGYFPNAITLKVQEQFERVINEYYNGDDKDDLLWMVMISVNAMPQRHCYRKSPVTMWSLIEKGKSLFDKPDGVGGAIGFLIWQIGMNLYLNDVDILIIRKFGIRYIRFVDDSTMVVQDIEAAKTLLPLIREEYAKYGCIMHPKKTQIQPVTHGCKFLGHYLKCGRIYVANRVIYRAEERIANFNKCHNRWRHSQEFLCSVNSYFGMLKHYNEFKNIQRLYGMIDERWFEMYEMNWDRLCLEAKSGRSRKHWLVYRTQKNLHVSK